MQKLAINESSGVFRLAHTDSPNVTGQLSFDASDSPVLVVNTQLVTLQQLTTMMHGSETVTTISGRPRDIIADYAPHTIIGELADGCIVTLFDARIGGFPSLGGPQQFDLGRVVIGADASSDNYVSCRFILSQRDLFNSALYEMSRTTVGDLSLSSEVIGGRRWLRVDIAGELTWRELESRILRSTMVLFALGSIREVGLSDLQVLPVGSDEWADVYIAAMQPASKAGSSLISPGDIDIQTVARWLSQVDKIGPLTAGLTDTPRSVVLQTDLLKLAVIAEGLHDRLFRVSSSFGDLTKQARTQVKNAATAAALDKLRTLGWCGDYEEAERRFQGMFAVMSTTPYRQRLVEIGAAAEGLVHGMIGQPDRWADMVVKARNALAHSSGRNAITITDDQIDLWASLYYSLLWAMRAIILVKVARIDESVVRAAHGEYGAFGFYLVNTSRSLGELRNT